MTIGANTADEENLQLRQKVAGLRTAFRDQPENNQPANRVKQITNLTDKRWPRGHSADNPQSDRKGTKIFSFGHHDFNDKFAR